MSSCSAGSILSAQEVPAPRRPVARADRLRGRSRPDLDDAGATERMNLTRSLNTTLWRLKLRSAFEEIAQAKGDLWTAGLRPNPTLSPQGQLLPLTRPFTVDRTGGPPVLDVGLSWQLDWFLFGKRTAAIVAANKQVQATEQEYYDTVRQRVRDAALAFYDVLEAQALAEQSRQDLENLQKVEGVTQKAVESAAGRWSSSTGSSDRLPPQSARAESLTVTTRTKLGALADRLDPVRHPRHARSGDWRA